MKLFCINLKKSILRREKFNARWVDGLGYKVEYFDAVDKHIISSSDLDRGRRELDKLSFSPYGGFFNTAYSLSGVMACSFSHKALLKFIQHNIDEDGVVVFEDDVIPLDGANKLEERIATARKHFPQVEAIICNAFLKPTKLIGFQILNETLSGKTIYWDESIHTTSIKGSGAALVKFAPPGSFFVWYSRQGVARMINLIEGREFIGVDVFYGSFAHNKVLAIFTPGIGYHPSNQSEIRTPPYTLHNAKK